MYILQQSIIKINDVLNIHGFCLLTLVVPILLCMYLVVVTKIVFESKSLLLNNNIALFKIIRFMLAEMHLKNLLYFENLKTT